jgi:hypothetical protein
MTTAQRFWPKVQKTDTCWLWTGTNNGSSNDPSRKWPYGQLRDKVDGKWVRKQSHRISWELHNGPIPKGLWVLHRCDTTLCVNPDHLFLGTPKANTSDMVSKGRSKFGGGKGSSHVTKGRIGPRIELTCAHCKSTFKTYPSLSNRPFCSKACYLKHPKHKAANGRWSKKFDQCTECHSSERPYGALGKCVRCYGADQMRAWRAAH